MLVDGAWPSNRSIRMTKIQKAKTKEKKRAYSPLSDPRRFSDGVRMHEYLGYILMEGGNHLSIRCPNQRISRADFSRAALPVLKRLGLVALIDPTKPLPLWLRHRERKLVKRGGMKPIWMPTPKMPLDVWRRVVSDIHRGEIVWATSDIKP
jgi:hypothetical protein